MSTLHYILTGKDFAETRNKWHENTWLKRIGQDDDYVFIEGESDPSRKVFGSGTPEGPGINSILKIVGFYKHVYENWTNKYSMFDWFFFSDSDCYVFPDRAKRFLEGYSSNSNPMFIGKLSIIYDHPWPRYGKTHNCQISKLFNKEITAGSVPCCSGGAGYVMNNSAMKTMSKYIVKHLPELFLSEHYDLGIGVWLNDCDIPMTNSRLFFPDNYKNLGKSAEYIDDNVITLHYMTEKEFYEVDAKL